jgi:hypothetical protein
MSPIVRGSFAWGEKTLKIREAVEDRRRSPDFQIHFRIEGAFEASPNYSVRDIDQITGIALPTVSDVPIQVLRLEFRNWRWVPHK